MKLWYSSPARQWCEALPVGNGRLGGMVYGGCAHELIKLNEDSIWSGKALDRINPDALENLQKIREMLHDGQIEEAERLAMCALSGVPDSQRAYQPAGELTLDMPGLGEVTDYRRELDLEEGIAKVVFSANETRYTREVFSSYPDGVLAVRLDAEGREGISFDCRLGRCHNWTDEMGREGDTIWFTSGCGEGGISFCVAARVRISGGTVGIIGQTLTVENARNAEIYLAVETSFRHEDFVRACRDRLDRVWGKTYEEIRSAHCRDYRKLFGRLELAFAQEDPGLEALPVDERLQAVKEGKEDIGLVSLYFQYGRYLLIASSREGSLPANLQGIWNESLTPPWDSKFTININTEMNYWMAEKANLSDCHMPLLELIERTSKKGEKTAQDVYHLAGWVSHHNLDIWGHSSPVGQFGQDENPCTYSMWPMSSGWLCCHLWEHYCYTLDEAFLKKKAFPIIQGAVEFYLGYLVPYKGYYVTAPSTSPENTFLAPDMTTHGVTFASTMDISILRELFGLYLKACEILGVEDFTNAVKNVLQKLPPYKIGKEGQLQEWFYDYPEADINHRHISHLFGLYPGNQIHKENEPLIEACRTSLERRGDKGTGWCMAWKACLWAKLGDGNHALTLLKNQLRLTREEACSLVGGGIYPNMLCAHPPFQIDGNFGFAAAVLEMLVQYEEQKIVFLPALPDEWKDGMAEGVKAPGNITLNFKWKEKRVTEINLKSPIDAKLVILYNGMEEEIVLNAGSSYQKTLI